MAGFEDAVERFWDRSGDYLVQPPLTVEMLEAAQRRLGVRLPASFVDLLRVQNGGVTAAPFRTHPARTSWAGDHARFEDCFGIGDAWGSVTDSPELNAEWEQPSQLVLLHGDGHRWVALDYRRCGPEGEPSVVWYDNELGEDLQLATDFRTFVEGLRPAEDFDDPVDLDRPPSEALVRGGGALSAAMESIRGDRALLADGKRGLANTKAWCRAHAEGQLLLLPASLTRGLAGALDAVDHASDAASLDATIDRLLPQLEALIPAWIAHQLPGWALDQAYLRSRE